MLKALSPIVPFMYLDAVCDGILKGLDQQKFTFRTSVSDSALRIVLILLLLKSYGIYAFIGIMYFSNFYTCFLNTKRLLKTSGLQLDFLNTFVLPLCIAFSICLITDSLLRLFSNISNLFYVVIICAVCIPLYSVCLLALGIINRDDLSFIKRK